MGEKILVLDVDETILNMEPLSYLRTFKKNYLDYEGKKTEFFGKKYYISARPRLKECLALAESFSNIVAFSVVNKEITEKKLNVLGIKEFFAGIYGKDDLINKKKSLKKISEDFGVDKDGIVAIDDEPSIYIEDSVIRIKPFFIGSDHDYEFEDHADNLFWSVKKASDVLHGIKVVPPVLQEI